MGNNLSIGQVANYRALSNCGVEELAAHQWTAGSISGGVAYARKKENGAKDGARWELLSLFSPFYFPGHLSILTMPGVDWKFETALLRRRERDWQSKTKPTRTCITSIENDRPIYHGALMQMPGMRTPSPRVKVLEPTTFAERVVSSKWISRFYFGNVDDLMRDVTGLWVWDCAWLDYTGPLTTQRLDLIREFYARSINHILVVTCLKARWNRRTSSAIHHAGGHFEWVRNSLGSDIVVLHDIEYSDGRSPMAQIAVAKRGSGFRVTTDDFGSSVITRR